MMANYGILFISRIAFCLLLFSFSSVADIRGVSSHTDKKESNLTNIHSSSIDVNSMQHAVQLLKKNITKLYIAEASRKKRSYNRHTYDIQLDQTNVVQVQMTSSNAYPFVCFGKAFVLQSDGVYQFDGFSPDVPIFTEDQNISSPGLKRISEWTIDAGDNVLDVKEWEQKCFVLITNQNRTFSSIYTLHGDNMTPVFRQQMRNYGFAMSAQFFTLKRNLYLVIVNDNSVHSLTICPLLRWDGTYMDEIHAIQTRGAVAVATFTINSREYIAIAQSQDSSGNYEVGTQILRMDSKEELEKVQLLWSNNPNALQYLQIQEEHYLIVGQTKEPSIVYWFGGMDFIHWQTLKGYTGSKLLMDSLLLQDKSPVLLAAKSSSVQMYTWSTTSSLLAATSNASVLTLRYPMQIINAKFLRISMQLFLAAIDNDKNHSILKLYPVVQSLVEIAESQIKESENPLSQCLTDIRRKLDDDKNRVSNLGDKTALILTKSGSHQFNGTIITNGFVIVDPESTVVELLSVIPRGLEESQPYTTLSRLANDLVIESDKVARHLVGPIPNILMKSTPGNITGRYSFTNSVQILDLIAPSTNLQLESINGVPWADIQDFAMRKKSEGSQRITGTWIMEKLSTPVVVDLMQISSIDLNNFLLRQCPFHDESFYQEIQRNTFFESNVVFEDGIMMQPNRTINGVRISDVVIKNGPITEIRGYKRTQNIVGDNNFTFTFINNRNFPEWFNSVLHINGDEQISTGIKFLSSVKGNQIEYLEVGNVNNRDWKEFVSTILLNNVDQTLEGNFAFEKLEIEKLQAASIATVKFQDLLTANGSQIVNSRFTFGFLNVQKDLNTNLINGIPLSDVGLRLNEDFIIHGPVELENFKVNGSVTTEDYVKISGKDVSELASLRKRQIYYTGKNNTIYIRAPVEAEHLFTPATNDIVWDNLETGLWMKSSNNILEGPLDFRGRIVKVQKDFQTGTLNKIDVNSGVISLDNPVTISTPLTFSSDTYVFGDVGQTDSKTLNGIDISEITQGMVKVKETRRISGRKHFKANVVASQGIEIATLNEINLNDELVLLNSSEIQYLRSVKYFKNNLSIQTLHSDVDVNIGGTVNGHNLVRVHQTTAYKDQPLSISGNMLFNKSFYASSINIFKKLNDVNLTALFDNIIFLDEKQNLKFPVVIHNGNVVVQQSSLVTSINGINLNEYLPNVVSIAPPASRINGTKTFMNLSARDIACDHFNGISLLNLSYYALSLTKPQNISGRFQFASMKVDSNLDTPAIAGVDLKDLVSIDDPESCFTDADVILRGGAEISGPLTIGGKLNGYSVDNLQGTLERGFNDRIFKDIFISGDVEWENDATDHKVISNFFKNAVTKDTPQSITGKVHFGGGFTSNRVEAYPWINNVNLREIKEDAVSADENPTILLGSNTFSSVIEIRGDTLVDINTLKVDNVDGVNISDLKDKIINNNFNGTIYGTTIIDGDVHAENLLFKDLQKKGDFSWLAFSNDNRTIDHVILWTPSQIQNLNYSFSKDFDINKFLNNRLTEDGDQILDGNYTVDNLTASNDCNIASINKIPVSYILRKTSENHVIDGQKTFADGINIDGEADVPEVNGYNFEALHADVYRRGKKEKFNRPVVFVQPVTFDQTVQVDKDINDYRIEELKVRFSNALEGVESRSVASQQPQIQNLEQIQELKKSLSKKPMWLEYLQFKQDWSAIGPKYRVEYTPLTRADGGIISLHEHSESVDTSLPNGCKCNSVRFLKIDANSVVTTNSADHFKCTNVFIVRSDLENVYSVFDHSVSYNQTCKSSENSALIISKGAFIHGNTDGNELLLMEPSKGYLTDVKAFSDSKNDYLILAYYFDTKKANHDTEAYIYKINGNTIQLIQTIPTFGAIRIAITHFNGDWLLAIANNRDPKTNSCLTNSAIYRWASLTRKFVLLRDIRTNGATDVIFISVNDKEVHYDVDVPSLSFIAFAQSGNSGDGEVSILSYDTNKNDYFPLQSLRTKWSVTAVEFFCIQENCYLVTVIPQEGILFYEYRYVEGFQLSLSVPIVEAQDLISFATGQIQDRIHFAIASTKHSLLAEGVVAGQPHLLYNGTDDSYENNNGYSLDLV